MNGTTAVWIMAGAVWALFVGTVVRDYFKTRANKREAFRRDVQWRNNRQGNEL